MASVPLGLYWPTVSRSDMRRYQICLTHKSYADEERAQRAVEWHKTTHATCPRCAGKRVVFRAFLCSTCQGWHVGHKTVRM